ncbi:hypothetical protein N0O92_19750 [Alkalihalobacillus sp. MEB130]|uniref:hypothetical protein n=1 Tax=Alkalihalobacillus sp. MEB130 TaxID=2976704 RepID=UPI0028DDE1D9|nr:hypothetical protein [Alkalihalobacillus sp. MEB130]MDT8862446.1 hypothetical protein [Alkalihalobacillus sp. MEB130]
MAVGLILIVCGLVIGFITYSYIGLLLGLVTALCVAIMVNQLIYKRKLAQCEDSSFTNDAL